MNNKLTKTSLLIYDLRNKYNLTQQQLADALGVSKSSICYWESGCNIKLESLLKIANYFSISIQELVEGKLEGDLSQDFLKRTYDLTDLQIDDEINDDNINDYIEYIQKFNLIQTTFYQLLKGWATNSLNQLEKEEFNYIKDKYFYLDTNYYYSLKEQFHDLKEYKLFGMSKEEKNLIEKDAVNAILSLHLDDRHCAWELRKLYSCSIKIDKEKILDSNNLELIECFVDTLSQVEKDKLLTDNIAFIKEDAKKEKYDALSEIENDEFIKLLLNSGCRILNHLDLTYPSSFPPMEQALIDQLEGPLKPAFLKDNNILDNYSLFNNAAGFNSYDAFYNWQNYSLDEYEEMIDKDATDYYFALVNYKDSEPLKYYEALKKFNMDF